MPPGVMLIVPAGLMVRLNCFVAVAFAVSVTWTVNVKVPAAVGVPLRNSYRKQPVGNCLPVTGSMQKPKLTTEVPGGRLPAVMAQFVYGAVPLVAVKAWA